TTGDLEVDTVTTRADVSLATEHGSIVDARADGVGDDAANVIGNTINLYAASGNIGDPSGGNDLEIDSHPPAPRTTGARATNNINLTETSGGGRIVLLQALTGNIRYTVRESAVQGEDMNLLASGSVLFLENATEQVPHGLINTPQGSILLRI